MEKLIGWREFSINLEEISSPQVDLSSLQEEIQPQRRESSTQENINVKPKVKETKQSCMKEWTLSTSAKATADGRKRKAEVLAEGSKNKFVFNKRGKLKDDER